MVPPHSTRQVSLLMIPAAGHGTRLRPITRAIPKEMLPLGRKPVLEHVVDEARTAGIRRVLFIVAPGKEMIRHYFGDGEHFGVRCDYAVQPEMRGLADALVFGESWTDGEPFGVSFGDCVIESSAGSPLSRLLHLQAHLACEAAVLAERVPHENVGRYGILAMDDRTRNGSGRPYRVTEVVEKPRPEDAPSDLAVCARWAFGPGIFAYIRRTAARPSGEVLLTDAINAWLRDGANVLAEPLLPGECRLDMGCWESYLTAAALAACRDPDSGPAVRAALTRQAPVPEEVT